ncbi:MAG: hypothetical protein P9M14_13540 [Candidatus Alcyoniella australis]|nr:hypothetical protein [Candidatus Alcyoniella australis]
MSVNDRKWTEANGIIPAGYSSGTCHQVLKDSTDSSLFYACYGGAGGGIVSIDSDADSDNGAQIAYADLANACALTQDDDYLYIGTGEASGTGVHRIAKSYLAVAGPGGEQTAHLAVFLSTSTGEPIYSNEIGVRGLAFNDNLDHLAISCGRLSIYDMETPGAEAVYDSSAYSPANGPVVASGDKAWWVFNGDRGKVCAIDLTTPAADDFRPDECLIDPSDDFGDASLDAARWALYTEGSPSSYSATESGGALTLALTHRNSSGDDVIGVGGQSYLGAADFSVAVDFGALTTSAIGASDLRSINLYVRIFDATWSANLTGVIRAHKNPTTEWVQATFYRGGALIFDTSISPAAWSAGVKLYIERVGTIVTCSYDTGGGKTTINSNTHADNNNYDRLWIGGIYATDRDLTAPYDSTISIPVNDVAVVTTAGYAALPTGTINDIAFAPGTGTDMLLLATNAGLYKVDTDTSSAWGSYEDLSVETFGQSGSGADHEILHGASDACACCDVDSSATGSNGNTFVGTDKGVSVIDLSDDTLVGWFDSSGGQWAGDSISQSTNNDAIACLSIANNSNSKFAYGGSSGLITPDVDAPGEPQAFGYQGDDTDCIHTRWDQATDPDVDCYEIERSGNDDEGTWYRLKDDFTWATSGDYLQIDAQDELCSLRITDLSTGRYKVRVRTRDYANNAGDWTTSSWIYIGVPSSLSISILSGSTRTTTRAVTLTVSGYSHADAGPIANYGIDQISLSDDDTNWDEWREFTAGDSNDYDYNLPVGDGKKTVYVKGRDEAQNESNSYSSSIVLSEAGAGSLGNYADNVLLALEGTHFEGDNATLTSDSEASGYEDDNVLSDALGQTWRTTNGSGVKYLRFDLGSAKTIHAVAILGHNFQSSGITALDLKLQANTTDTWLTPALEVDLSDYRALDRIVYVTGGETYRYWRIRMSATGIVGYLEIGRVVLTSAFQPLFNFDDSYTYDLTDPSPISRTEAGHRRGKVRDVRRGYHLGWSKSIMTLADQETLEDAYCQCGVLRPVLVIPDPSTTARACATGVYGHLSSPLSFRRSGPEDYAGLTLDVEEITG